MIVVYNYDDCHFKNNIRFVSRYQYSYLSTGSCLLNGYSSCCSPGLFELCIGDDGTCHCDAKCYEYGDCCKDIDFLLCSMYNNT